MAAPSLFSARPKRFTTPIPLGPADVTNGLVCWLNGFGNSARDISGNNNNGTLGSATRFAPGPFGNAFQFNNSTTCTANLPAAVNLNIFTWTFWFRQNNISTYQAFAGAAASSATPVLYVTTSGNITFQLTNGGNVTNLSAHPNSNVWAHVAFSWNSVSGAMSLYVNGAFVNSWSIIVSLNYSSQQMQLGGASPGNAFNGNIADFRVYNRLLTPGEVSQIYNSALAPALDGKLLAFRNPVISATLAATESADSAAFSGAEIDAGTFAAAESPDAASFAGTETDGGTLGATEAQDAASFTGSEIVSGSMSASETPDTASLAGVESVSGAITATESPDAAMFAGALSGAAPVAPGCVIASAAYRNNSVTIAAARTGGATIPALYGGTVIINGYFGQRAAS